MTAMNSRANASLNTLAVRGAVALRVPLLVGLVFLIMLMSTVGCSTTSGPKKVTQNSRTQGGTPDYAADQLITRSVKAALIGDSSLSGNAIQVQTFDGVVQLSGVVQSEEAIDQAMRITRDVEGVVMIRNDLYTGQPAHKPTP